MPRLVAAVMVVIAFTLTACSQPPVQTSSAPVSLQFTVDNGRASPAPERREVGKGQRVEISVSTTSKVELHVHGYDLTAIAEPGKPAVIRFTADRTGTFEVEAHPDTLLVQLVVR